MSRLSLTGMVSLTIIAAILIVGILAPYICKHPHNTPSGNALEAPNKEHPMGTDDLGIDLFSQVCHGARPSLVVGFGTALLANILGVLIGIIAGYYGNIIDKIFMVLTDIMMAIPELPILIVLGAFLGPDVKNIILVLSILSWTKPCRTIRSKILSLKQENYIKVAQGYGASFFYILSHHFLPQIFPLIATSFIKTLNKAIIAEASLSFLGLGDPTSKSWGLIIHHALNFEGIFFTDFWHWWVMLPLSVLLFLVIAVAFLSRDMEKIFDIKL